MLTIGVCSNIPCTTERCALISACPTNLPNNIETCLLFFIPSVCLFPGRQQRVAFSRQVWSAQSYRYAVGEDSSKPNKCQGMRLTFISLNIVVVFLVVFVVLVGKIVIFYFVFRTE